jgi:4-hydroxy-tetrahydrodipicolinate reductase
MNNSLPKIAIVGYGSMGREIEKLAHIQDFHVTDIFDINTPVNDNLNYDFEVAIDFTFPDSVSGNVMKLAKLKKNIVLGTTGWKAQESQIKDIVIKGGIGFVHSSNFSVGMQLFFRLAGHTAKLLNKLDNYDIMLHEIHHTRKKDSPSGTAKTLAEIILKDYVKKKRIAEDKIVGNIEPDVLHVTSTRVGDVTGIHSIFIDSPADTIELKHSAKNRSGFAAGALLAAKWIHGRKGFFDFNVLLDELWK